MVLSSLKSRKDELSIALLEDTLFLNPPPPPALSVIGSESSSYVSTSQSSSTSYSTLNAATPATSAHDTEPSQSEPSNDKLLRGQLTLTLSHARRAKKIRVQLIGRSAAHGGDGSTSYEARNTLEKSLEIDLKGEKLEKGVYTWDFSFIVPSTTAVSERSVYGSIRYSVRATLIGAANVRDLTSPVQPVWLIANPSPEGELPSGIEVDVRHTGTLRSLETDPTEDINLGPIFLHISSPHLTVASLLFLSVTFENPPEGLKIMSVSAFILQSFDITFEDTKIPPVKPAAQKKLLFWVDSTSPIAESTEDLLEKPNLSRGTLPPLAFERRALLAQPLAPLSGGQEWTYARVTRVPDDDSVRPSTLPGTKTPIRVNHRLVVQVKYRFKGSKKDLVLEMSTAVTIASCCCLTSSLLLPRYRSHLSSSHHPSHHAPSSVSSSSSTFTPTTSSSAFLPTDGPLTPFHRRCLCNTPLQALVDQEGEALAGAAEMRSRSRSNSHSRSQSRARGGSAGFGAQWEGERGRGYERKVGEEYPIRLGAGEERRNGWERDGEGQSWENQGRNLNPTRGPALRTT
ncbi:uncharacterized protein JCM6883_007611 [Sporobolomyces salmoneus]|uniref:uncharacterized protein n=1 Tax=Sporobolomyces salmoneus TaxID=183962 RepID=UPI003177A431